MNLHQRLRQHIYDTLRDLFALTPKTVTEGDYISGFMLHSPRWRFVLTQTHSLRLHESQSGEDVIPSFQFEKDWTQKELALWLNEALVIVRT